MHRYFYLHRNRNHKYAVEGYNIELKLTKGEYEDIKALCAKNGVLLNELLSIFIAELTHSPGADENSTLATDWFNNTINNTFYNWMHCRLLKHLSAIDIKFIYTFTTKYDALKIIDIRNPNVKNKSADSKLTKKVIKDFLILNTDIKRRNIADELYLCKRWITDLKQT